MHGLIFILWLYGLVGLSLFVPYLIGAWLKWEEGDVREKNLRVAVAIILGLPFLLWYLDCYSHGLFHAVLYDAP